MKQAKSKNMHARFSCHAVRAELFIGSFELKSMKHIVCLIEQRESLKAFFLQFKHFIEHNNLHIYGLQLHITFKRMA